VLTVRSLSHGVSDDTCDLALSRNTKVHRRAAAPATANHLQGANKSNQILSGLIGCRNGKRTLNDRHLRI